MNHEQCVAQSNADIRRDRWVNALLARGFIALSLAALSQTAPAECRIDRFPAAQRGETITITMHVTSEGSSCKLTLRVGNGQAQSISVVEPPANGRVEVQIPSAIYTPTPGFVGDDTFLLAWFGSSFGLQQASANFRTRVKVEVLAKQP